MVLIEKHNAVILALQETKLNDKCEFKVPTFNIIRKDGHVNVTTYGGVALLIHSDSPYQEIELDTTLQAVVARVNVGGQINIVCTVYISRAHRVTLEILNDLKQQLPSPTLIMGDFNAYNMLWKSTTTDRKGIMVEHFMRDRELNLFNNRAPTRVGFQTESAIDLTLCTPYLAAVTEWSIYNLTPR